MARLGEIIKEYEIQPLFVEPERDTPQEIEIPQEELVPVEKK